MAFKHNLPLPAVIFGLVAAALLALVLFHRPPEQDLLRQAVDRYASTLGPIKELEIHGSIADILTVNGRLVYAEFEKKNGEWVFARNLAEEFSRAVKDPSLQKGILEHLTARIGERFKSVVTVNENLNRYNYDLYRDRDLDALIGRATVDFSYPKVGGQQKGGRYVETFEWKDGRWQSQGPGALFDKVGP